MDEEENDGAYLLFFQQVREKAASTAGLSRGALSSLWTEAETRFGKELVTAYSEAWDMLRVNAVTDKEEAS